MFEFLDKKSFREYRCPTCGQRAKLSFKAWLQRELKKKHPDKLVVEMWEDVFDDEFFPFEENDFHDMLDTLYSLLHKEVYSKVYQ